MTPSQYINSLRDTLAALSITDLRSVEEALFEARLHGRTVFIAGNGGSASTASHMANDR